MEGNTRRALLAGAGAAGVTVALAGCSAYGEPNPAPVEGKGAALAKIADIPLGGGLVFPDQGVVVTQPEKGVVKGFRAICTHQGCTLSKVDNGTINCGCHGSRFHVADGSVAGGPAPRALDVVKVAIEGDSVKLQ
jgi:Rieske Fe-S protein